MYLYEYEVRSQDGSGVVIQLTHDVLYSQQEYENMVTDAQRDTTDIPHKQARKVEKKLVSKYGFVSPVNTDDMEYGRSFEHSRM